MKTLFNIIVRECLKELTKKKNKRVSLSTKIVYFSVMIFPITFILSMLFSSELVPNFFHFFAKVFCFMPLGFAVISYLKADYLVKKEEYIEKLVLRNFSKFLDTLGVTDELLIDNLKRRFFRKYVSLMLKDIEKFTDYRDIRNYSFHCQRTVEHYLYFTYLNDFIKNWGVEKDNEKETKNKSKVLTSIEKAIAYFNLAKGFTKEELKGAYRRKLKEVHPDCGGTNDEFLKAQSLFELLKSNV